MRLKVGELAKRSGLTVRTLHHYDAIGLLKPSARSDAGYRLYNAADIARLHSIQALRHLGLRLEEIAELLVDDGASLPQIVARQIEALEREIAQANELHTRLQLLQQRLSSGSRPELGEWLATLSLMETYGKYFSSAELKEIFKSWKQTEAEWPPLLEAVCAAKARGLAPDAPELQPLVRQWMALDLRAMGGDLALLGRWKRMRAQEPAIERRNIEHELDRYMREATELRLAVLRRYFTLPQIQRLNQLLGPEWRQLNQAVRDALQRGVAVESEKAQAYAACWNALLDQTADHDPALRAKLVAAYRKEPLLRAGSPLDSEVQDFIRHANQAASKA